MGSTSDSWVRLRFNETLKNSRKVERLSKHHTAGTWQNTVGARWPQPGAQAPETTSWCITHSCPQGTCPKSPLDTQGKLEEGVPRQGDYNPTLQMGRQRTRRAKLVARDCTESELPTISTQWISVCPVLCLHESIHEVELKAA